MVPAVSAGVIAMCVSQVPSNAPRPLAGETPWFTGDQQPVQPGVYKRLSVSGLVMYSLHDGDTWMWNHVSASRAAQADEPSLVQNLPWRGLVAPPPQGYGPVPNGGAA